MHLAGRNLAELTVLTALRDDRHLIRRVEDKLPERLFRHALLDKHQVRHHWPKDVLHASFQLDVDVVHRNKELNALLLKPLADGLMTHRIESERIPRR